MEFWQPTLTEQELRRLLHNLDAALDVYEGTAKPLNSAEIRCKSMLAVLRNEVRQHLKSVAGRNPAVGPHFP